MVLSGSQREIVVEDIAGGGWVVHARACTHTHTHREREREREREEEEEEEEDLGLGLEEF